jgi:hypothetical protein
LAQSVSHEGVLGKCDDAGVPDRWLLEADGRLGPTGVDDSGTIPSVNARPASTRAAFLEGRLRAAAAALILVLERIEPSAGYLPVHPSGRSARRRAWPRRRLPPVDRPTHDRAKVSSRRPAIEQRELTTSLTARQAIHHIRERTEGRGAQLSLTNEQLAHRRGP